MNEKIVIVTLNYNQNDYTLNCINSLLDSNYKNFQILLIDNGSTEENYLQLKNNLSKDSRIILDRITQNIGYVGGINYGLEQGVKLNPDYFIVSNNDIIIDKDTIAELLRASRQYNSRAIVSGKIYQYDYPNKFEFIGYSLINPNLLKYKKLGENEIDQGQFEKMMEMDNLDDIFWLIPVKLYLEIGAYSPYFWFNAEQADFALRALKKGYKLIYSPNSKIWHKGGASIGGRIYNPKLIYWDIQSSLILRYTHLSKFYFIQFYFLTILSITTTLIKSLILKITGEKDILIYARAKFSGWVYFNKWVLKKNKNIGTNPFIK